MFRVLIKLTILFFILSVFHIGCNSGRDDGDSNEDKINDVEVGGFKIISEQKKTIPSLKNIRTSFMTDAAGIYKIDVSNTGSNLSWTLYEEDSYIIYKCDNYQNATDENAEIILKGSTTYVLEVDELDEVDSYYDLSITHMNSSSDGNEDNLKIRTVDTVIGNQEYYFQVVDNSFGEISSDWGSGPNVDTFDDISYPSRNPRITLSVVFKDCYSGDNNYKGLPAGTIYNLSDESSKDYVNVTIAVGDSTYAYYCSSSNDFGGGNWTPGTKGIVYVNQLQPVALNDIFGSIELNYDIQLRDITLFKVYSNESPDDSIWPDSVTITSANFYIMHK